MIQRIQSIFLLFASVSLGLLFVESFDYGLASNISSNNSVLSDGDYDTNDHPLLAGLTIAAMIISLISIFLFKNRNLQSNIAKLGALMILGLCGAVGFYFGQNQSLAESVNGNLELSFGLVNPLVALLLVLLAIRGISKDDKLVKSMDRLR